MDCCLVPCSEREEEPREQLAATPKLAIVVLPTPGATSSHTVNINNTNAREGLDWSPATLRIVEMLGLLMGVAIICASGTCIIVHVINRV